MSTPVDLNITMPYGVTMVGDGTNNPKLAAPHPKQMQNFGLKLPPGPCRIAASWEGEEKVGIVVQTNGTRNYRTIGNIPEKSGGVHVKGCSPSGRSKTTTCTSTDTSSHPAPRALSRFTRSTSNSAPRRGGGVGDHSKHRIRLGRAADDLVLRSICYGGQRGTSGRSGVSALTRGRVHHHSHRKRHTNHSNDYYSGICGVCGNYRGSDSGDSAICGAVECGRAIRLAQVLAGGVQVQRRRGGNHRHLPAVVAAGVR